MVYMFGSRLFQILVFLCCMSVCAVPSNFAGVLLLGLDVDISCLRSMAYLNFYIRIANLVRIATHIHQLLELINVDFLLLWKSSCR